MATRIDLNGSDWQFKDFYGEDWIWRDAHLPTRRDNRGWRTGTVPGTVQNDLLAAGEIPDPYFERNSLLIEWVPDRTWVYRRTFTVGEEYRGKRIQLRFEGVDYEAQFFLNGDLLGQHRGMYTPALFEVTDKLKYGEENLIVVVIEPAPYEQPQIGRTTRVRTLKSRMTYWWDFCPRVVHLGIWEGVSLDVTGPVRIEDVFARPQLAENLSRADVSISTRLSSTAHATVEVETTIRREEKIIGQTRTRHVLAPGETSLNVALEIIDPHLWWPNGCGEQALYQVQVRVIQPDNGEESDQRDTNFGIRKIEFAPNDNANPAALPYTLVVNNQKVYIRGWNWVPLDVMYGVERPEKLEHLLILARRAHVNLLRVWGGGLIEREAFYNLCDRLGILVWQEFIQSSSGIDNNLSEDPQYVEMLTQEAAEIIPRKRNHPSLAIWCGGNELQSAQRPLDDKHPTLTALYQVVKANDPDRLWLPTSPTGPVFMNSLENLDRDPRSLHDVHGPWEHQGLTAQYALYNRTTSLLHSEFGAEGITNLKTLRRVISEENRWPVTLDSPIWHHLGAWWVKEQPWRDMLGEVDDLETLIQGTQLLQAEAVRYAIEANRRRKYQNSGTLPWQFNEPFPMAACTSAIDYYGQAKPLYYAVARAYEPLHVSARFASQTWADASTFEAEIWVNNNDEDVFANTTLEVKLVGPRGRIYTDHTEIITVPDNASIKALTFRAPLSEVGKVFFLDLWLWTPQMVSSQNRYLFTRAENLAPALSLPRTSLEVRRNDRSGFLTITNTGVYTALFVWLEDDREIGAQGYVYFDDNHFCLLPNETRSIAVAWNNVPEDERRLSVGGWNTETEYV